jgi:D-sedoheptulose 7-phosphate isomerase
MSFSRTYIAESVELLKALDTSKIDAMAEVLATIRDRGGRLFILGFGGSAGHAGHAVNDFRKICGFEAYAPTDNVSELTARTNDEGWEMTFGPWLTGSRIGPKDGVLVLSVGGGDKAKNVSANIVRAIDVAIAAGASVTGIVGRSGGYTAASAHACVVVPPNYPDRVTPHTEGLAAVVWHLLVSHPHLKQTQTKWEGLK